MSTTVTYGYLERPYLVDSYATGVATSSYPTQVTMVITSTESIKTQVTRLLVDKTHVVASQAEREIAGSHTAASQVDQKIASDHTVAMSVDMVADDISKIIANQVDRNIIGIDATHSQTALTVANIKRAMSQVDRQNADAHDVGSQVSRLTSSTRVRPSEVRRGRVIHEICGEAGYLVDPYLESAYLVRSICAHVMSQVELINENNHEVPSQVSREIADKTRAFRGQVTRVITKSRSAKSQVDRVQSVSFGSQVLKALYNTYNLRVLYEFPSRGTTGLNWTANSTEAGDFNVNNLNTDIVEQVWRSASGVKTGLVLVCDTQISQGIFMDTLGMLGHNLTRSAIVTLQGANDSGFSSIGFNENLEVLDEPNLYYIAPILPTSSYRYWRFIINDTTNTNDSIQIGTIVFGSSIVFQGDNITDEVTHDTVHFSDKVATEGYTNVSNDRALKYAINIDFKFLQFQKDNYKNIRKVFRTARTSLKCLWIPTPQFPERFAVFGKLPKIPSERHKVLGEYADYVSFNVEVDESL
jgi:hypothetical protein